LSHTVQQTFMSQCLHFAINASFTFGNAVISGILQLQFRLPAVINLQGVAKKVAPQSFLPFSQQLFGGLSKFFYKFIYCYVRHLSAK